MAVFVQAARRLKEAALPQSARVGSQSVVIVMVLDTPRVPRRSHVCSRSNRIAKAARSDAATTRIAHSA